MQLRLRLVPDVLGRLQVIAKRVRMMLACFYGLVGFGWLGMLFVQAELPRISHENLLHNFKEGVFIVDEDTSHLQFTNRAASKIIKGLEQF